MVDKIAIQQVLGCLMKKPSILSETDKYSFTPSDFSSTFEKIIFGSICGLYANGAKSIGIIDIENYVGTDISSKQIYEKNNGIEYLQDIENYVELDNFDYYYNKLKKINLLRDLNKMGIDTKDFYEENLTNPRALEINDKFEQLTISDIIDKTKAKVLGIEKEYLKTDVTETRTVVEGIEELIEGMDEKEEIGVPIQGKIFNEITAGARKGALYIRSAASGTSKTRQAVGDACFLAFPLRYNQQELKWERIGGNEKVLFIATEQNFGEIQKMILAYLTGINESRFKFGDFNDREKKLLSQAVEVMKKYKDNFLIVRMPNPTIGLVKTIVRENCLLNEVEYVFYDYIFIGPSLLNEFKGFNLRNDEVLLMFATALKDLAVELDVFVMSSTQVNAHADDNKNIRNESTLAGGRSTINKADVGVVMARTTPEELKGLTERGLTFENDMYPNIVTDIYKVRSGEWNQVRIWSSVDLGTLRKVDLFITDSQLEPLDNFIFHADFSTQVWEDDEEREIKDYIASLNF